MNRWYFREKELTDTLGGVRSIDKNLLSREPPYLPSGGVDYNNAVIFAFINGHVSATLSSKFASFATVPLVVVIKNYYVRNELWLEARLYVIENKQCPRTIDKL